MDSALARRMQRARSRETSAEHALRCDGGYVSQCGSVPLEVQALTLTRLWAQPEVLVNVRTHHRAMTAGQVYKAAPRNVWTLGLSAASTAVWPIPADVSTVGGAVAGGVFGLAALTAAVAYARLLLTLPKIEMAPLAHTAWELAEPLECEEDVQWEGLLVRVREYIELRRNLTDERPWWMRLRSQEVRDREAEQVRLHLSQAAVTVRQLHAAREATKTALEAGNESLVAVPALRADLGRADEALAALRPVALTRKIGVQMLPLELPTIASPGTITY